MLVLPGFAAFGLTGARVLLLLIGALGVAALWQAIREQTGDASAAWAGAASLVLQLPFLAQSSAVFPDGPAAAITAFALLTLIRAERDALPAWRLAAVGAALAFFPWLHLRLALLAVVFGAAIVATLWQRRAPFASIVSLLAVPITGAVLLVASSFVMFGTLDPTAAFRGQVGGSLSTTAVGAFGLLADVEYGLLPYAPAMIFGIAGVVPAVRRHGLVGWTTVAVVAGTWLAAGSFAWWGGTSSPARFLVPVLPAIALCFGVWWSSAGTRARMTAGAAIVMSTVVAMFAAWADGGTYVMTVPDGRLTIFEWTNRLVQLPDALPSLFRTDRVVRDEVLIAGVWAFSGAGIAWAVWRMRHRFSLDTWTVCAWAMIGWLAVASSAAWALRPTSARTTDRSQLALLQQSARPWLSTPWRRGRPAGSIDEVLRALAFESPGDRDPRIALHVPYPPAGRYQIEVTPPKDASPGGLLALEAGGRGTAPLWSWAVGAPELAPSLTTVMPVHSFRVTSSDVQDGAGVRVRLIPLGREQVASSVTDLVAEQTARYGDTLVYLVDSALSVETGGFWLAGDRRTRMVVARLDGTASDVTLQFEAGTLPVTVQLARGAWHQTISIADRGRGSIDVPGAPRVELMELDVIGGERQRSAVFVSVLSRGGGQ